MPATDLTVSAVVLEGDRYLLVEEYASGRAVINQPGGHIESGESPEAAAEREVLEETGCRVRVGGLIGVYLWLHPVNHQQFLRIVFAADFLDCDANRPLDDGIIRRLWLRRDEVEQRQPRLRTPAVLRCIQDFEAGRRQSDEVLAGDLSLSLDVDAVLARADLV
jgi:8-oxo-dGTP pyrophosphatase MutT (NUDIX family)